jgi:hypothetical protein
MLTCLTLAVQPTRFSISLLQLASSASAAAAAGCMLRLAATSAFAAVVHQLNLASACNKKNLRCACSAACCCLLLPVAGEEVTLSQRASPSVCYLFATQLVHQ